MKRFLLTALLLSGSVCFSFGQTCCNVVSGLGTRVVTKNGKCVVAKNLAAISPCSVDSDGDGIFDNDDNCPAVAGLAEHGGCPPPDKDGDGVLDANDACPNTAGTIDGCPDSDKDGIADKNDDCPLKAGTLNGCPDADGDGIRDNEDKCPQVAGLTNTGGCPDADGDGVIDSEDHCPAEAGILANKGCPELDEETKEALKEALEGVKFQTGSDVLTRASFSKLDKVVAVMKSHDAYNLKISGYTDNVGNAEKNKTLSDKRAHAAEKYIISQGVDASRIKAKGYGIENPVADNNTAAGRAKNRRVEFEIGFD